MNKKIKELAKDDVIVLPSVAPLAEETREEMQGHGSQGLLCGGSGSDHHEIVDIVVADILETKKDYLDEDTDKDQQTLTAVSSPTSATTVGELKRIIDAQSGLLRGGGQGAAPDPDLGRQGSEIGVSASRYVCLVSCSDASLQFRFSGGLSQPSCASASACNLFEGRGGGDLEQLVEK